jgi:uncharacterized protein (TIGR02284 family)
MSANHEIAKLDDLITTIIDSIRGYEHSAEKAPEGRYASFFERMATERRGVLADLQAQSRALGGTPTEHGSTAGTVHRFFESMRTALGGGDSAVIAEVERGEDYLKEEFERVLKDDQISAETMAVVRAAFASVLRGHDEAAALKHELEAAD